MFRDRGLYEKLDAALKLADERHDRTMKVLESILEGIKDLRETQIAARKNGNGNGARAAQAAATATKKAALPAGYIGGGAALTELLRHFLG